MTVTIENPVEKDSEEYFEKIKQNYIDIIREDCIRANPDIMDLKFGCEVDLGSVHGIGKLVSVRESGHYFIVLNDNKGTMDVGRGFFTTIGRTIRLADILLTVMKRKDGCNKNELKKILLSLAREWNCFSDDVTLQSVETLRFIAALLNS